MFSSVGSYIQKVASQFVTLGCCKAFSACLCSVRKAPKASGLWESSFKVDILMNFNQEFKIVLAQMKQTTYIMLMTLNTGSQSQLDCST